MDVQLPKCFPECLNYFTLFLAILEEYSCVFIDVWPFWQVCSLSCFGFIVHFSPVTAGVECLFWSFLTIRMFSFVKCLIQSSACF